MSDDSAVTDDEGVALARPVSPWLIAGGILFILVWGAVWTLLIAMSLMGTLMANDGGAASSENHSAMILGVLISQVLTGLSGIPAGLAFFWRSRRGLMLILFAILLVIGILGQVGAFMSFMQ